MQIQSENFYSNAIYLDDNITPVNIIASKNFFFVPLLPNAFYFDESYENFKNLNYFFNLSNKVSLNSNKSYLSPQPYSQVFDAFRADFDDFT